MADEGQVAKLERHLSLLRQEYVKLQNKLVDLEQKYSVAVATSGQTGEHDNTFVSRLLRTVSDCLTRICTVTSPYALRTRK
ncbi:Ankyrin repeat and FYVE domain-containing protein 1 [Desmophyllum pertusum]|uniref:Ankyrin repeat and FYVE domain-containing protein 1 n=1 Tax=Desmophyllum pertusum TaxID=174260 RepID=A0A9W9Z300_9CNID|nr:Ankyrin repeat and FYVE domain-containing protein 1 [Desmophyllum pertusum]